MSAWSRAAGIALGIGVDAALGDPQRWHPVAGFGRWAGWLERRMWRDDRTRGALFTTAALAPAVGAASLVGRATSRRPWASIATTAAVTWSVVGAHQLAATGRRMADLLDAGDLDAARALLPHLCGRLPDGLDAAELARATVESLAENTSDAVTGSLVWGALLGVPGLVLHRGANTLDAMVGHRNARFARFGTASARLDDLVNLAPARLTGVLFCALAPLAGGSAVTAAQMMLRDHAHHPSPNGGWCEAAMAGALGVQLGGRNVYPHGMVETRGLLGEPTRALDGGTVRRAAHLVTLTTITTTALAVATLTTTGRR